MLVIPGLLQGVEKHLVLFMLNLVTVSVTSQADCGMLYKGHQNLM